MMKSEFIERTGYEPDYEEYRIIEESYYDFPGNKDEFCKQWLKDKADGHLDREMKLRKQMEQNEAKSKKIIDEQEENLQFYREQFDKMTAKIAELRAEVCKYDAIMKSIKTIVG